MLINYYAYTDQTVQDKQVLADILQGLKEDYPNEVKDLNDLQFSGDFERICRLVLPYTSRHVAQVNTDKKVTTLVRDKNLQTTADFIKYLEQTAGLHVIDDASNQAVSGPKALHDLHLRDDDQFTVDFVEAPKDLYGEWLIPQSEPQLQRLGLQQLPKDQRADKVMHEYVISSKMAPKLVKRFKREVLAVLPKASFPPQQALETVLMQTWLVAYRRVILKSAPAYRPVFYVPEPNEFDRIAAQIVNQENVVEEWNTQFRRVDGHHVFDQVMSQAQLPVDDHSHDLSEAYLSDAPSADHVAVREMYNVDPKTGEPLSRVQVEVVSEQALVFDDDGKLLQEAPFSLPE